MNDSRPWARSGIEIEQPLLRAKKVTRRVPSTAAEDESFEEVAIRREEVRHANHRSGDRHRLDNEEVELIRNDQAVTVTLVNLSGGGAMIEGADGLKLWDQVELQLAEGSRIEAVVRWIRHGRLGLEFAQETRIEGNREETEKLLREVIRRSFPGITFVEGAARVPDAPTQAPAAQSLGERHSAPPDAVEREARLPMIWTGVIHYNHGSYPVRLRNISSGGALIETSHALAVGGELLLELDRAGSFFATVNWARGDNAGLRFHEPFDLQTLAASRPTLAASRWEPPGHVRTQRAGSVWSMQQR